MTNPQRSRFGKNPLKSVISSPWLWGGLATWGFYQIVPFIPVGKDFLTRYCCGHPLEYVETTLFLVGMAIIVSKSIALIGERKAFKSLPRLGPEPPLAEYSAAVAHLEQEVDQHSNTLRDTYWGHRLEHLLAFFHGRQSSEDLDSHLTYLAEAEADRLHSSHALLQTVIWSIPILGFLGTVMGITLAIADVTPEQLESSLNDVTSGLAVAFDTTAVALTYSLVMGFASLFVKRREEQLLVEIDETCRLESHRCFGSSGVSGHPLLEAEEQAAQLLIHQTSQLIDRQTSMWNQVISTLSDQWAQTLNAQLENLAETLQAGTRQTLETHAAQLAESREQMLAAQAKVSSQLIQELDQLLEKRQAADENMLAALNRVAEKLETTTASQIQAQSAEVDRLLSGFASQIEHFENRTSDWQSQLAELVETLGGQGRTLLEHGSQLERIANQEESLLRLQDHLNRNLESIRNAEVFDETLHSLNAAVHLLTTRVRNRDAA